MSNQNAASSSKVPPRDFSKIKVENAIDFNKFLLGALKDVRMGNLDHDTVKSITLIADKINKNNTNTIDYKKLTRHSEGLTFFDQGLKDDVPQSGKAVTGNKKGKPGSA